MIIYSGSAVSSLCCSHPDTSFEALIVVGTDFLQVSIFGNLAVSISLSLHSSHPSTLPLGKPGTASRGRFVPRTRKIGACCPIASLALP